MQSRSIIPRDSYSNKSGIDKLNVCKISQFYSDEEPILYDNYGNRFEPKRSNRFRKYKEPMCTTQIIHNGQIICVISSKLQMWNE